MNKNKLLIAVDIETSGCQFSKHGILAIGFCIGDLNNIHNNNKYRINFALDENIVFEKRCMDEFWSKNMNKLEELKKDQYSPKQGIQKFIDYIDNFEKTFELIFISDNPTFDFGFINYYLDKYLDRRPLSFNSIDNSYRPLFDTDCYTRGVLNLDYSNIWTSDADIINKLNIKLPNNIIHDHLPENDAEYILELHKAVINHLMQDYKHK